MTSPAGEMPGFIRVDHQWSADSWWSAVRCRLGRFGAHSRVAPGLYALGRPDAGSAVLVTASYRLSFDLLRRDAQDIECWILVLDTRGLGVGSAAASGMFGTDELVTRVAAARLSRVVSHRTLILPGWAAAVIDTGLVAANTGFEVRIGPGRTVDIPAFLSRGAPAGAGDLRDMRVLDALALTPAEAGRSLTRYAWFAFAALLYAGLGPGGVSIGRALAGSWPLLVLGLASVACGSVLAPVTNALVPRIPLWVHGAVLGSAATAALLEGARLVAGMDRYLAAACAMFFPVAAALIAAQFAQAMPGDRQPPAAAKSPVLALCAGAVAVLVVAALVLSKSALWRRGP
ncbi:MAG: hypothetical protein ACLQDL_14105 [Spirochaetia bacterium]